MKWHSAKSNTVRNQASTFNYHSVIQKYLTDPNQNGHTKDRQQT